MPVEALRVEGWDTSRQRQDTMQVTGLYETHLPVTDLDRSVAFYRDVVGLQLAQLMPERGIAFFWIGAPRQAMLGLWQSNPLLRMHLHIAFSVSLEELLAAPTTLRRAGIVPRGFSGEETDEPVVLPWVPAASVFCTDPDRHSLEYLSVLPERPRPELGIVSTISWSEWRRVVTNG
ncbi:MAG TPA: VOC family protein [Thermomicrobiales bacterium]|nr:VOC family protein [Thermomicrobiales bacterium]